VKLPKLDRRHLRLLLNPCLLGLLSVFVSITFIFSGSRTLALLSLLNFPFGFSVFFYAGKLISLLELEEDMKAHQRKRAVSDVLKTLNIK
jgi:hypothetical protein